MIFDMENWRDAVISRLQSDLNTEIDCINTEKGDFAIDNIPSTAYFSSQWEGIRNQSPYIAYGLVGGTTTTQGRASAVTVDMKIDVVVANKEQAQDRIERTILRYLRAMHIVLGKDFHDIPSSSRLEIREWNLFPAIRQDQQNVLIAGTVVGASIVSPGF